MTMALILVPAKGFKNVIVQKTFFAVPYLTLVRLFYII